MILKNVRKETYLSLRLHGWLAGLLAAGAFCVPSAGIEAIYVDECLPQTTLRPFLVAQTVNGPYRGRWSLPKD